MKVESIKLGKFSRTEIDRTMQSKISGGEISYTVDSRYVNPDRREGYCTGDYYDYSIFNYYGKLTSTIVNSPVPL